MLYGIVDIGSNTIRFKVYECKNNKIKSIFSKKKTAGLIAYHENGKLNNEGINILISVLNKFNKNMDLLNVDKKYFFATASLRNITNTIEVLNIVKDKLDIDINVLDGKKEADLSFNSIKSTELSKDEGILIDVGGGSCELTIFENRVPVEERSLPVGSLYCYEKYVGIMFPNNKERKNIEKRILNELINSNIGNYSKKYMFGVGGTVRNVKRLLVHLNFISKKSPVISIDLLDKLLEELNYNNKNDFNKILKIKAERIHTIVPGIIIIKTIASYFNVEELYFCKNSLREGVLYALLNGDL
ncbi:exopolyphosphatase [uncultured Methanobrevibacter sp.]|uniref:Ppx/GppA phosphatase family protein n=1 Tax=uncultured Methanobrevibacter sp. TaxID=253161 RepID=UPI0026371D4A|nr:exopolyphosphatase [uncultured Methanobrevibacter sp.]